MGPVTIDASVFLNAFQPAEEGHRTSQALMEHVETEAIPIICPALLLPEVSATISRGTENKQLAIEFARTLQGLPHLMLIPLEEVMARQALTLAAELRLRGSDAVYASTAFKYASTLITLDKEMHDRAETRITTQYPEEFLAEVE